MHEFSACFCCLNTHFYHRKRQWVFCLLGYAVYIHVYVPVGSCGFSACLACAVYIHVYVLTDACGFSVCLAIAVCMQFMSLQMRVGFLLVLLLSAAIISQSEGGWLKNVWGKVKQVRAQYLVSPFVCV